MTDYDEILDLQRRLIDADVRAFLYGWILKELQADPRGRRAFQRVIHRITGEQRKKIRSGK